MVYLRKRYPVQSVFKFGELIGIPNGTTAISFTVTAGTIAPGDTIFLNIRAAGNSCTNTGGFDTIANITGLFSGVRYATLTDTGTYNLTWSGTGTTNGTIEVLVSGRTLGYTQPYSQSVDGGFVHTLPSISMQKNSAVLICYTSAGGNGNVTDVTYAPGTFIVGVDGGFTYRTIYKPLQVATTEGFTLTWTGGIAAPARTRMSRIELLGLT